MRTFSAQFTCSFFIHPAYNQKISVQPSEITDLWEETKHFQPNIRVIVKILSPQHIYIMFQFTSIYSKVLLYLGCKSCSLITFQNSVGSKFNNYKDTSIHKNTKVTFSQNDSTNISLNVCCAVIYIAKNATSQINLDNCKIIG